MKTLIVSILILCRVQVTGQTDIVAKIDSLVSAINLGEISSIDSGMVQLKAGKYAKFETTQYEIYLKKQLATVNYIRVYVEKEDFVAGGNDYSGWYRDFIDFSYSEDKLVKITHDVGAGLVDSTFLMLQRHQYYFNNGKLIHRIDDSYGNDYSNYVILSPETLYQMSKDFLNKYKKQIR